MSIKYRFYPFYLSIAYLLMYFNFISLVLGSDQLKTGSYCISYRKVVGTSSFELISKVSGCCLVTSRII